MKKYIDACYYNLGTTNCFHVGDVCVQCIASFIQHLLLYTENLLPFFTSYQWSKFNTTQHKTSPLCSMTFFFPFLPIHKTRRWIAFTEGERTNPKPYLTMGSGFGFVSIPVSAKAFDISTRCLAAYPILACQVFGASLNGAEASRPVAKSCEVNQSHLSEFFGSASFHGQQHTRPGNTSVTTVVSLGLVEKVGCGVDLTFHNPAANLSNPYNKSFDISGGFICSVARAVRTLSFRRVGGMTVKVSLSL